MLIPELSEQTMTHFEHQKCFPRTTQSACSEIIMQKASEYEKTKAYVSGQWVCSYQRGNYNILHNPAKKSTL